MSDLRDKIWMLGETPGSHHKCAAYRMPGVNKMTPMEGLEFFGVRNLCRMKMTSDGNLSYVDDALIKDEKGIMDRLSLSLTGAGERPIEADKDTLDEILEVARRDKRLVSAIDDDFFDGDRPNVYTPAVLAKQREILHTAVDRPIEFWSVIYERSYLENDDVYAHAREFDLTTFWIWFAENIRDIRKHFEWGKSLTKEGRVILGIYMWDYGNGAPVPDDLMKYQLDFAYEKLVSGEAEGIMLHSSNNADIGLTSTEITKQWLAEMIK